jgi:hypothetical protein
VTGISIESTLHHVAEANGARAPQNIEAVIPPARVPAGKHIPHGKYLTVWIEESTGQVVD